MPTLLPSTRCPHDRVVTDCGECLEALAAPRGYYFDPHRCHTCNRDPAGHDAANRIVHPDDRHPWTAALRLSPRKPRP